MNVRRLIMGTCFLLAMGAGYVFYFTKPKPNPRFEPLLSDLAVPVISARGYKDGPPNTAFRMVPGFRNLPCSSDLIIVVHGFNNNMAKARNRFGVARQSLETNGYNGEVIGFSWDADTQHDPFSATGFHAARANTVKEAPILADAISRIKLVCPQTKIRILGYSMGARLALEALLHLKTKVDAIYLVGAAVDNEEVELGERYGKAIEEHCGEVVNLYSPEDSKLGAFFWAKEGDRALGKSDIEHPDRKPSNYLSINVSDELPEVDERGRLVPSGKFGKNHSGYLGTRDDQGRLTDDGAMNRIADRIAQFK